MIEMVYISSFIDNNIKPNFLVGAFNYKKRTIRSSHILFLSHFMCSVSYNKVGSQSRFKSVDFDFTSNSYIDAELLTELDR